MNDKEQIWRELARQYQQQYEQELQQERQQLEAQTWLPTTELDGKVWGYVAERKRRRRMWSGLAAAAVVLVLLTPALLRSIRLELTPPVSSGGMSSSAASSAASSMAPAEAQPLPLTFALPGQFSVAGVELDQGKTVYTLDNSQLDPVVMTLEQNADTAFLETLTPLTLEGRQVYGLSEDRYQLLAFEQEGILYTLTCQHDLNTLAELGRSILL